MLYKKLISPILFLFDAEKTHTFVMAFVSLVSPLFNLILKYLYKSDDVILYQILFKNKTMFKTPLGLGAGFDKNGDYIHILKNFGFGFLELGTVTPKSQYGNPKPRIFRLKNITLCKMLWGLAIWVMSIF